ncbi:LutC/YkgG family protein [Stieleria varia]|uniref:Lactate utilization protein C n=1 Tax=Stieleria varia TaxID=2528005 RepID=A0A5C6AS51_9BACT|nr:LUD domain-containing protein [Stieleria varia]TWU02358.1 Lactate utilization protein C [Stieleria varia]
MKTPVMKAHTRSRQAILDALDSSPTTVPPLPELDVQQLTTFDDPLGQFIQSLAFVGGEAHVIDRPEKAYEILSGIPAFSNAKQIASVVPEAVQGNVDAASFEDPHALSGLDWTIARGEFMVAENGAIWVDGETLPHRVMIFIAQYLAIVVPRGQIVCNMHQAYERVGKVNAAFGIFVSGPSKTADIEQSLVLGAHGCRKLQVFIVGE